MVETLGAGFDVDDGLLVGLLLQQWLVVGRGARAHLLAQLLVVEVGGLLLVVVEAVGLAQHGAVAVVRLGPVAILGAYAGIFANLPRLFVLVENRLCSRVVNLQLIGSASNRVSL